MIGKVIASVCFYVPKQINQFVALTNYYILR